MSSMDILTGIVLSYSSKRNGSCKNKGIGMCIAICNLYTKAFEFLPIKTHELV